MIRRAWLTAATATRTAAFGVAIAAMLLANTQQLMTQRASVAQFEATEIARYPAVEARQGAAVSPQHIYAVTNAAIGRYDRQTGAVLAQWEAFNGGPFIHLNSCKHRAALLVCAHSNFSDLPMTSSVEMFDPITLEHRDSVSLGAMPGSLTWLDLHDGAYWAGFAEYGKKGGTPGRDNRFTQIVRFDAEWRRIGGYILPSNLTALMAPYSASGGAFGPDGLLYIAGHDRPELYALRIPEAGSMLEHVATIAVPFAGQAFSFAPEPGSRVVYGVHRPDRVIVATRLPPVVPQ